MYFSFSLWSYLNESFECEPRRVRTPSLAPRWAVALAVRFYLLPGIDLLFIASVVAYVVPDVDIIAVVAVVVESTEKNICNVFKLFLIIFVFYRKSNRLTHERMTIPLTPVVCGICPIRRTN